MNASSKMAGAALTAAAAAFFSTASIGILTRFEAR